MKKEIKLRDLIKKDIIDDYTRIYLYDNNNLKLAEGNWYEDNILKYRNREILSCHIIYIKDTHTCLLANIGYLNMSE